MNLASRGAEFIGITTLLRHCTRHPFPKKETYRGTPSIPLGRIPYGRDRGFHIGCKGTDCVTHSLNDVA